MANRKMNIKSMGKSHANELHKFIQDFCSANADPKIVKKYVRFFKEGYDGYGVDTKAYEEGIKSIKVKFGCSLRLVQDVAPLLMKTGKFEETSIAIRLLKDCQSDFDAESFADFEKWFELGIINWAHADFIAGDITPIYIINKLVPLKALNSWRIAPNKFQRRVSAVTLIKLLKNNYEVEKLLKFVEPMMMDNTREVQQGVGWFLREAWKLYREPVEQFLTKWKDKSPRLIYQYATEKMVPKEKERFRKNKSK